MAKIYMKMRGNYTNINKQLFVFKDGTPVRPANVRAMLKKLLKRCNMNSALFSTHSMRSGRASELIRLGYPIEVVKRLGRWKSNAVYKYIKD